MKSIRKTTLTVIVSLLIGLLAAPQGARAYNPGYNNDWPDDWIFFGDWEASLALEIIIAYLDAFPDKYTSHHEALVAKAIGQICEPQCINEDNADDFFSVCPTAAKWLDASVDDLNPSQKDRVWKCACGFDTDFTRDYCETIGIDFENEDGGLEITPFASLLAGARYVDFREMTGLEANDAVGGLEAEDGIVKALNWDGKSIWDNKGDQASKFPPQHAYYQSFLTESVNPPAARFFKVGPYDDGFAEGMGMTERKLAMSIAVASYLLDRFLQANESVVPRESGDSFDAGSKTGLLVNNFWKLEHDLKEHEQLGLLAIAASILGDEILDLVAGGNPPGCGDLACAACIWSASNIDDEAGRTAEANLCLGATEPPFCPGWVEQDPPLLQCSFTAIGEVESVLLNDTSGETVHVEPDLFAIGQATHAIGDAFAHTIRDYGNRYEYPSWWSPVDETLPIGGFRKSGGDNWHAGHSDCYDADCLYSSDFVTYGGPQGYETSTNSYDSVFFADYDNQLGLANSKYSVMAVREWLNIFDQDASSYSDAGLFAVKLELLRLFMKKHLAVEIPQEQYGYDVDQIAPYNTNPSQGRCFDDLECNFPIGISGRCDEITGLCRQICSDDSQCDEANGFTCSMGAMWTGEYEPARRYCQKIWDPWDFIADEYFINEAESYGIATGSDIEEKPEWIHEEIGEETTVNARHWYWLTKHQNTDPQKSYTWLDEAVSECYGATEQPREDLVGIVFSEINFSNAKDVYDNDIEPLCIYRNGLNQEVLSGGELNNVNPKSLYVSPRYRMCLERTTTAPGATNAAFCLYGGLNGSGESYPLDWWRGQIESVRWNIIDIDHDGVSDHDDNCLFVFNEEVDCIAMDANPDVNAPPCCYEGGEEGDELQASCQPDFDGDGFGDACDRDMDEDGVLEDGDGPWGRGNGTFDPCRGGNRHNCDDNCHVTDVDADGVYEFLDPKVVNPVFPEDQEYEYCDVYRDRFDGLYGNGTGTDDPTKSASNVRDWHRRYTRNNYQEDLDDDGIGDVCDEDRDGDMIKNIPCNDYETWAVHVDPRTGEVEFFVNEIPEGQTDCNDFLWTVAADVDRDGVCDLYQYSDSYPPDDPIIIGGTNVLYDPALDLPEELIQWFLLHNGGYGLDTDVTEDHAMNNYRLDKYGEGPTDPYWADVEGAEMGESGYTSWPWCQKNVMAVRAHGREGGSENGPYYETNYDLPNISFLASGGNSTLAFENDTLEEAVNVLEACELDNCIRHAKSIVDGETIWDPLTGFLCNDDENGNGSTALSDFTTPHWGQPWEGVCNETIMDFQPTPSETFGEEQYTHSIYKMYFNNPAQWDNDHDGVGDQCSVMPKMNNFEQEQVHVPAESIMDESFFSEYWNPIQCSECPGLYNSVGPGYEWCDEETCTPIVMGLQEDGSWPEPIPGIDPAWTTIYNMLCNCSGDEICHLSRFVSTGASKLSFDTQGFSIAGPNPNCSPLSYFGKPGGNPDTEAYPDACSEGYEEYGDNFNSGGSQEVTFGACACAEGEDNCFIAGDDCEQSYEAQFDTFGRPRYKHHKEDYSFGYDASPYKDGTLDVNDRCQVRSGDVVQAPDDDLTCYWEEWTPGWNLSDTNGSDGCERIEFNFRSKTPTIEDDEALFVGCPDIIDTMMTLDGTPVNHREMLWKYVNEPEYWGEDLSYDEDMSGTLEPDEWGWEDKFPFAGRTTVQWAGWAAEKNPVTGNIEAWNNFQFTEPLNNLSREQANFVWYDGYCVLPEPPSDWVAIDPHVSIYDMVTALARDDATRLWDVKHRGNLRSNASGEWVFGALKMNLGSGAVEEIDEMSAPGFSANSSLVPTSDYAMGAGTLRMADGDLETFNFIFGGKIGGRTYSNTLWLEDVRNNGVWKMVNAGGSRPPAMTDARVTYDVVRNRILILGGRDSRNQWVRGLWVYDVGRNYWYYYGTRSLPYGVEDFKIAVDTSTNTAYLYGGTYRGIVSNRMYSLALSALSLRTIWYSGVVPPAFAERSVAFHPKRKSVLVFGGTSGGDYHSDMWEYSPSDRTWVQWMTDKPNGGLSRTGTAVIPSANADTVFLVGGQGSWGSADVTKTWEITPGSLPLVVDSAPEAVIGTKTGAWMDLLTPDHKKRIRIGYHAGQPGVAQYLNVHLSIPLNRILEMEIVDSSGQVVGGALARSGVAVATINAQPDEFYYVRLFNQDSSDTMEYSVWVREAVMRTRTVTSSFAVGGTAVIDDVAYVAAEEQLEVYQPDSATGELTQVASLYTEYARDVVVEDNYAYVAAGDRGLVVVDISDPQKPVEVASETSVGYAKQVAKYKNRVYVSSGQFGVMVYKVLDPTSPVWIDTIDVSATAEDVAVGNGLLAVATLSGEIRLYSLKGRTKHQQVGELNASDWVREIRIRGEHLFVLLVGGNVEQYDVGDLSRIRNVGEFEESDLAVTGKLYGSSQTILGDSEWLPDTVELQSFEDVTSE